MQREIDKRARRGEINNRLCYYQSRIYGNHGDRWR